MESSPFALHISPGSLTAQASPSLADAACRDLRKAPGQSAHMSEPPSEVPQSLPMCEAGLSMPLPLFTPLLIQTEQIVNALPGHLPKLLQNTRRNRAAIDVRVIGLWRNSQRLTHLALAKVKPPPFVLNSGSCHPFTSSHKIERCPSGVCIVFFGPSAHLYRFRPSQASLRPPAFRLERSGPNGCLFSPGRVSSLSHAR